ncbi:acyl-CoA dehydrogenase NM domain-like protein [Pseudohyphozyma bogoriensis]|nr:acyl-CoA dehydrogenase NM domain-like protein [Pseudohyphozyma bogoriensis]
MLHTYGHRAYAFCSPISRLAFSPALSSRSTPPKTHASPSSLPLPTPTRSLFTWSSKVYTKEEYGIEIEKRMALKDEHLRQVLQMREDYSLLKCRVISVERQLLSTTGRMNLRGALETSLDWLASVDLRISHPSPSARVAQLIELADFKHFVHGQMNSFGPVSEENIEFGLRLVHSHLSRSYAHGVVAPLKLSPDDPPAINAAIIVLFRYFALRKCTTFELDTSAIDFGKSHVTAGSIEEMG